MTILHKFGLGTQETLRDNFGGILRQLYAVEKKKRLFYGTFITARASYARTGLRNPLY